MGLKSEQETVISWSADDRSAEVYSLMPRIWKQCLAAGGEEIKKEQGIRDGKKVARTFLVPIRSIGIRKKRVLSAKAVEGLRTRGRALAARNMGLGTK